MSWIKWLESKRLVTAAPDETIAAVVERMVEHRVGSALIMNEGRLEAIFSERDVMARVVGAGRDPKTTPVSEVATRDPKVVREDADLSECARLVKNYGFRHVPVVDDDGRPVGMISARDFLSHTLDELENVVARAYGEKRREQMVNPYDLVDDG